MNVLLIVLGLLLILFGGGCTIIVGGVGISDPSSLTSDWQLVLSIWLPLGLVPLALGIWLFRVGLRNERERRAAAASEPVTNGTAPKSDAGEPDRER